MTPQNQQPSSPSVPMTTSADAHRLAEGLMDAMSNLLSVIERETELVRAGDIREAMRLDTAKGEMSREYMSAMTRLKDNSGFLVKSAPELLTTLHRHHDVFRAMLQVNMTVLATAHSVSEGIIRGVNSEIQRRNLPQGYTAAGHRANPNPRHHMPLSVSRSL